MRISSALAALLLAACSGGEPAANTQAAAGAADTSAAAADDGRVPCARGSEALQRVCTVEQVPGETGLTLTLRHPGGGFRRLAVTRDGRGVIAADGAEAAKVTVIGQGEIEVTVGGDRYRLPATIKPGA
jgi:hypothetical protein